jgi:glucuronoarabinoxylan endo-1,4-beta-xylanase
LLAGCGENSRTASGRLVLAASAEPDVVIDVTTRHQRIAGFGASSAWTATSLTDERADTFFSPTEGLGLSLLRLRITPSGTTDENGTALKAAQRGVAVWAAPWSPPGAWKTSPGCPEGTPGCNPEGPGTDAWGGHLLPEYYDDWAARLANFAANKANEGIPLIALSSQNEPDWVASWETCEWTPTELTTFVRDHLGPALRARDLDTKLMTPESANWDSLASYADPMLADPDARAEIGIVAVHDYGGTAYAYTAPADNGKEFWETEISYHDFTGIDAALQTATSIHEHLTVANVNAFHYWWLMSDNVDSSLFAGGRLTPQAYGLGQYSRFIRPGFFRVEATPSAPVLGLVVSAYFEPTLGRLVIVAVNSTADAMERTFGITGSGVTSMSPWVTNETLSLEPQISFAVSDSFAFSLAPKSITTFVGDGTPAGTGGTGGTGGSSGGSAGSTAEGGAPSEGGAPASGGVANEAGAAGDTQSAGGESGAGEPTPVAGQGGTTPGSGGDSASGGFSAEPGAGAPNAAGGSGGNGGSSAGRGGRGGSTSSGGDEEERVRPGNACACRTVGTTRSTSGAFLGVALALGLVARRRRAR